MRAAKLFGGGGLTIGVGLIALLAWSAGGAQAATMTVTLTGFDPSPYSVFSRSVIDPATNTRITSALMDGGRFVLTPTGGDYQGQFVGEPAIYAFCIEPREFVSVGGTYEYDVVGLEYGTTNIGGMGEAKAELLSELFGRYLPDFSAPISRLVAGALQIATWEIVREDSGSLDVYGGDIYFYPGTGENPAGVVALAQSFVTSIDGTGPKLSNLVALTEIGAQDLITQVQTPEPASTGLIGAGLVLAAIMRRRKGSIV